MAPRGRPEILRIAGDPRKEHYESVYYSLLCFSNIFLPPSYFVAKSFQPRVHIGPLGTDIGLTPQKQPPGSRRLQGKNHHTGHYNQYAGAGRRDQNDSNDDD